MVSATNRGGLFLNDNAAWLRINNFAKICGQIRRVFWRIIMMSYFVYVLRSLETGRYYIGSTNDITRRLKEHNAGSSRYTRTRGSWQLAHFEERKSESEARNREKFFKSGDGRRVLMKILEKNK